MQVCQVFFGEKPKIRGFFWKILDTRPKKPYHERNCVRCTYSGCYTQKVAYVIEE